MKQYVQTMMESGVTKFTVSNPVSKTSLYKKITAEKKQNGFQIAKYTEKQVFHENVSAADLADALTLLAEGKFRQINGFAPKGEHILLISKKGACKYSVKQSATAVKQTETHNRKKEYLLPEGEIIPPLVDMGIFTAEGKVVASMYRKYKQINRFLEMIDDELREKTPETLNVIDFGCGKSYLTFILYYYLTQVRGIHAEIIGLDLKADVIEKCNAAAKKYGYEGLRFELGDINGYTAPFDVDMVVTLHACDTATDHALFNALSWGAKMIFSVPCCQHELNGQLAPKELTLLSRYGIVGERFCALATDAIRANLLEYCGYKTQLLEFIELDHTPKNVLIRAVKRPITPKAVKERSLAEVKQAMDAFGFEPTLYRLLGL
ncbi:MAG: SAM-dependent methyltransferase [Clostridia bacterium]|nr:SAM-dependent methyltransferase [Clostridia bacterium]